MPSGSKVKTAKAGLEGKGEMRKERGYREYRNTRNTIQTRNSTTSTLSRKLHKNMRGI